MHSKETLETNVGFSSSNTMCTNFDFALLDRIIYYYVHNEYPESEEIAFTMDDGTELYLTLFSSQEYMELSQEISDKDMNAELAFWNSSFNVVSCGDAILNMEGSEDGKLYVIDVNNKKIDIRYPLYSEGNRKGKILEISSTTLKWAFTDYESDFVGEIYIDKDNNIISDYGTDDFPWYERLARSSDIHSVDEEEKEDILPEDVDNKNSLIWDGDYIEQVYYSYDNDYHEGTTYSEWTIDINSKTAVQHYTRFQDNPPLSWDVSYRIEYVDDSRLLLKHDSESKPSIEFHMAPEAIYINYYGNDLQLYDAKMTRK